MNRTAIDWADFTWNPITGCLNDCPYCYARRIAQTRLGDPEFKPTFHEDRLHQPLSKKKPAVIFTCSMGDFFGRGVDPNWEGRVVANMDVCPEHTFVILTKQPQNIHYDMPENCIVGVSVDGPDAIGQLEVLRRKRGIKHRLACFEPLLERVELTVQDLRGYDWVIIGGQTGPKFVPPESWVHHIVDVAIMAGASVFVKDNAEYRERLRQFPECVTSRLESRDASGQKSTR